MLHPANAVSPSAPNSRVDPQEKGAANGLYNNAPTTFDTNIVIIMAALLCVLICALSINSIVRCALRCTSRILESPEEAAVRLSSSGMKKKEVKSLPTAVYGRVQIATQTGSVCPICFYDFADGERLKILPGCKHAFHVECIDPWLMAKSSCPTCRNSLMGAIAEKRSREVQILMTQCRVISNRGLPRDSPTGPRISVSEPGVSVAGTDIAPRLIVSVNTSTPSASGSAGAGLPCPAGMLTPEETVFGGGAASAPAGVTSGGLLNADNMLPEAEVLGAVGSPCVDDKVPKASVDDKLPKAVIVGVGDTLSPSKSSL